MVKVSNIFKQVAGMEAGMKHPRYPKRIPILLFILLISISTPAESQSSHPNLEGMWSNPPGTAVGTLCAGWCTDAGIDYLNKLLDDPANDSRPFDDLQADAPCRSGPRSLGLAVAGFRSGSSAATHDYCFYER